MLDPVNVKFFKFAVGSDIGKEGVNDVSSRCIICGDSQKNKHMKRLHLYRKSSYKEDRVACFNCGWHSNMYGFLKETNSNLFDQYRAEKRQDSFNSMKRKKEPQPSIEFEYKVKQKLKLFDVPDEFIQAKDNKNASDYLKKRMVPEEDFFYSESGFELHGDYRPIGGCIITPLWYSREDEILYGFQARSIEGKTFYTYIPEQNTGMKVWCGIDFQYEGDLILVSESVFDSKSMGISNENIGAILGSTDNDHFDENYKYVIYCLDNQHHDHTSKKRTKQLLKSGKHVFVWPKQVVYKDFNEMLTSGVELSTIKEMITSNVYDGMKGLSKLL